MCCSPKGLQRAWQMLEREKGIFSHVIGHHLLSSFLLLINKNNLISNYLKYSRTSKKQLSNTVLLKIQTFGKSCWNFRYGDKILRTKESWQIRVTVQTKCLQKVFSVFSFLFLFLVFFLLLLFFSSFFSFSVVK